MSVAAQTNALSVVVLSLMKGVLWREDQERLWQQLLSIEARVRDYVSVLGLVLEIDESEGYALLRQLGDDEEDEGSKLPRLVARHPLSFPVSMLLVLLRQRLVEADGAGDDRRVVLSKEELIEMLRPFLKPSTNEARLHDQISGHVNRVRELGFLRVLRGREDEFEVARLLKSFVDASWLDELLTSYRAYAAQLRGEGEDAEERDLGDEHIKELRPVALDSERALPSKPATAPQVSSQSTSTPETSDPLITPKGDE